MSRADLPGCASSDLDLQLHALTLALQGAAGANPGPYSCMAGISLAEPSPQAHLSFHKLFTRKILFEDGKGGVIKIRGKIENQTWFNSVCPREIQEAKAGTDLKHTF